MSTSRKQPMDSVDHAWLRMENQNNLMMIGIVLLFEDKLDLERLRTILQDRLIDKHERFSQRIVHDPGNDYWQTDPDFSIDNHLVPIGFPHDGDKKALQTLASDLVSTPLARDKPLWCINEISHYDGGSVLVIRIHHCIADGMSLVRLVISLTDDCADPASAELCMSKPTGGAGTHHHESLRDLISHPSHMIDVVRHGLSGAEELASITLRAGDPPTSLKGPLKGRKKLAWAEPFALQDVKRIGHSFHATVNDLLMAAATGALRHLLTSRGEDINGKTIHTAVPFNLRPVDAPIEQLGNQFGLVLVPLPIGVEDPLERLQAVKQGMEKLKRSYQAHVFFFLLQILGKGPSVLEQTALEVLSKKASVVMTNVPGPKQPLYLAGSRLKQPLAWVPQSGDIGIGLSILTYNDTVQFGFIADTNLVEDVDEMAVLFVQEFRVLEQLINEELHQGMERKPS